jgi:hypothetical protein
MRRLFVLLLFLCTACAQGHSSTSAANGTSTTFSPSETPTSPEGWVYLDAKLGFRLTVPLTWRALPRPGAVEASVNASVTFEVDEPTSHAVVVVGVFHGTGMPTAFAQRGTPTTHIGQYPAFDADRTASQGRAPCLVRIFLARDDYIQADWCAADAPTHQSTFERALATYQPAPQSFVSHAVTPSTQTCAATQQQLGYAPAAWGKQLAAPTSAGWRGLNGVYLCSNTGSPDWYLFQCTEVINRYLAERLGLPHLPGNAARYLDYYQDGAVQPGVIRTFPAGSYQVSDDASQGTSTFPPAAGDVLVFQDVNDPRVGWTSGLTSSPGHVALIVGVDATHVYLAQENYNDTQYFLALPLRHVAAGYEITDRSGLSHRVVRGWIRFAVA